jgi:ribosomal protein S18 acetylase RimI-like enzyme
MNLLVEHVDGPHYQALVDLRYRLLREPLGIAREAMDLTRDGDCVYVIAVEDHAVLGVVALELPTSRLRQMAVRSDLQRSGIGQKLVQHLETEARARGLRHIELHARETAIGFYEKLGYEVLGSVFTEVGIPHFSMTKTL